MTNPAGIRIEKSDVDALQGVDEALKTYYAAAAASAAAKSGISEREIRQWIGRALITKGFRGQVIVGPRPGEAGEIALTELESGHHLIRSETRGGLPWYELSHDRLVEPVTDDNAAWEATALAAWQREAIKWDGAKRPPAMLLTASLLTEAERWVEENPGDLLPVDDAYLAACRVERDRVAQIEKVAAQNRTRARAALSFALVAVLLLGGAVWGLRRANVAEGKTADALAVQVEAQDALVAETKRATAAAAEASQQATRAEAEAANARAAEETADDRAEEAQEQEEIAKLANRELASAQKDVVEEKNNALAEKEKADQLAIEAGRLSVQADNAAQEARRQASAAVVAAEAAEVSAEAAEVARSRAEVAAAVADAERNKTSEAQAETVIALRNSVTFIKTWLPQAQSFFFGIELDSYSPACEQRGTAASTSLPDPELELSTHGLQFTNTSGRPVTLYLLGADPTVEIEWAQIEPGERFEEEVLGNWAWVIADDDENCVALVPFGAAVCVANAACLF